MLVSCRGRWKEFSRHCRVSTRLGDALDCFLPGQRRVSDERVSRDDESFNGQGESEWLLGMDADAMTEGLLIASATP